MPAPRRSLVVLVLLITWHAFGPGVAPASEFPEDTNTIESLSPEQARRLVTEFRGVRVVVERKGRPKGMLAPCLPLNGLKSVDADLAEALAGYHKGPLFLDGLTMLSVEAAKALAQHRGVLSLSGLTTLSDDASKALAEHEGVLLLDGLTTLSAEAARMFAQRGDDFLFLPGLTTLSEEAARALAQHKGVLLALDGLTTLSDKAAAALGQHAGILSLSGLTTISAEVAKALAEHKGELVLNGLTTLSVEAARSLAQHRGTLRLDGLTTLSADAAKAIAAAEHWTGYLPCVTTLDSPDSVVIAQALATRHGPLSLPNLKKLSRKTLSALFEKVDIEIPPIKMLEFIPEPDGSDTDQFVIPEGFLNE